MNLLIINRKNYRGKTPLGVQESNNNSFNVSTTDENGTPNYLGTYSTKEKAFEVYKEFREGVF